MSENPTRLSKDWEPTVELIGWAKEKLDTTLDALEHETEKFRNYWWSSPGRKGMKHDWPATWRVWMGNTFPRKLSAAPAADRKRRILRPWAEAKKGYYERFTTEVQRPFGEGARTYTAYEVDRAAAFKQYCQDVENGVNGVSE